MGKDFNLIDKNTRLVLFEKREVYYYKKDNGGKCFDICNFRKQENTEHPIHIGSGACNDCFFNNGYDNRKGYIICRKIREAISK